MGQIRKRKIHEDYNKRFQNSLFIATLCERTVESLSKKNNFRFISILEASCCPTSFHLPYQACHDVYSVSDRRLDPGALKHESVTSQLDLPP